MMFIVRHGFSTPQQETNAGIVNNNGIVIDWTKADDSCMQSYVQTIDNILRHINIPVDVLSEGMCLAPSS